MYVCVYVMQCMYVCNVFMYTCNVCIYVYTSVYVSLYVQCLYNSVCLTFHISDTNKEKANSYQYRSCSEMDSLYCGWVYVCGLQLDLWLTARTRSDCKNTLSTTAVASRQCREGLRKMNIICHGRCSSRQSKKAHSN
jgi:hypothetical protein